jgi:hypothetical protein
MNLEPEQFDDAFSYYELWIGRFRAQLPVEEWWRKVLPSVDPGEFPALLARMKEIEVFTSALCKQVLNKELTLKGAAKRLEQEFPSLSGKRLEHFLWTVHSLSCDKQFDTAFKAYEVSYLFQHPVEEDWRRVLPNVDPGEYPALLARMKEIEIFTFALCEQVLNNELTLEGAVERLQQEYLSLSRDRLQHFLWTVHSHASSRREAR